MAQLGRALTVLLKEHERQLDIADDLAAFHAPDECWRDAFRGEAKRLRHARRRACHIAGVRNMRLLRKAFRRVLGNDAWIYRRYGHVFY